jgi:methyl-accepting chemotaxis protein
MASPAHVDLFKRTVQGPAVDAVAQMEQAAIDNATAESFGPVDPAVWFERMTAKIDLMHTVEVRLADDVAATADQLRRDAEADLLKAVALGAVTLLLSAGGAAIVVRSIVGPVRTLTRAATALAHGDLDYHPGEPRRDEIGQLATAFQRLADYLHEVADAAKLIAAGTLTNDVAPKSERDVLGTAFREMTTGLRDSVRHVRDAAVHHADTSQDLGEVTGQVSEVVDHVAIAIQQIAINAEQESVAARASDVSVARLKELVAHVTQGAQDQTSSVHGASDSTAQMASGVEQVAMNANALADTAHRTRTSAEQGVIAVERVVTGMAEIQAVVSEASDKVRDLGRLGEKIGAVVETIDDIAEQTNLLALNAAIEAARAGEHGRGFAVVADEVRKLAERSQRETREIGGLIGEVQVATRDAVTAMEIGATKVQQGAVENERAGQALGEILSAVEATVDQVEEIAAAAQEMAAQSRETSEVMATIVATAGATSAAAESMIDASTEVGDSIRSITAGAAANSAATEEVSASAEEMNAQTEAMARQSQELASTALELHEAVARFVIDDDDETPARVAPTTVQRSPVVDHRPGQSRLAG